jgi:hypothetical protein
MNGSPRPEQTVADMWKAFANQAAPGRQLPVELRVAYHAGCHAMLAHVLAVLRSNPSEGDMRATWQRLADEMGRLSDDYNAGKFTDTVGQVG